MKREILFAKYMTYLLLFIIALLFSLGSFQRNLVWRDGQTLWTSEKRRFPDNMRAYRELGNYYRRAGMLEKAVTEYKEVLRLNPELTLIRSNLGGIYGMMGRLEEAIRELKIVLATDPDNVKARYNLALAYVQLEQCDAAVGELTYLLTLDPQNQSARKLIRECPLSGKE